MQKTTPPMPATRQDLFARLEDLGIATETKTHPPVYTVEEARALRGEIAGGHCKNLFLKDKKQALWLVVCREDAAIDLKALPARIGSARISFGKPDLLMAVLGVEPGSVTPFALINDTSNQVNVILDETMMKHDILNYHPLDNTATTSIAADDLVTFIRSCGHNPQIVNID
jgi:Ala-tRNA(Pro) deacylase